MAIYARIERGVVAEIIQPAFDAEGNEYPIEVRFVPQLVATMVDITDLEPMPGLGWGYDGELFTPPEGR